MFKPWRGERYGDQDNILGGNRLLILGESCYTNKVEEVGTAPQDFTCWTVRNYPLKKVHNRFFHNIQCAVLGQPESWDWHDYADMFWNSVAFFNYVPVIVDGRPADAGGRDRRPEQSMFEAGAEQFRRNLAALEPDAVVVCGLELWNWVAPNLDGFKGPPRDVIFYDDGRSIFARIHHPSVRQFDTGKWHGRIHELIEKSVGPHERGRRAMWRPDGRWTWESPALSA